MELETYMSGWIGFDLDGTLAEYTVGKGCDVIGDAIWPTIQLLRDYHKNGIEVKIFTARVSHDGTPVRIEESERARRAIEKWCETYIGFVPPITNTKDYSMWVLYDDRAIQVERNTGRVLGNPEGALGSL